MSTATYDEVEEVDLSKLINFGVTFEPLKLTMRGILHRLAQLEKQNSAQDDRIAQLSADVEDLEDANKALKQKLSELSAKASKETPSEAKRDKVQGEEGQTPEFGGVHADNDAIWEEIARLNNLLGELQDGAERNRHSIDEIYAARKCLESMSAVAPGGEMPVSTAAAGEKESGQGTAGRLSASSAAAAVPAPVRKRSPTRSQCGLADAAAAKPVGDVILEKAHEELEFGVTQVYTALEESAPTSAEKGGPQQRRTISTVLPLPSQGSSTVAVEQTGQASRPLSVSVSFPSRAGGEDAGENRSSVAFSGNGGSRPTSHAHRRSVYADQRIAEAAARRASQLLNGQFSDGVSPSVSVFDKLKRDGEDIAYLNRVVAEILGEMKELHANVDQLRTSQEGEEPTPRSTTPFSDNDRMTLPPGANALDLDEVRHRLARVEADLVDARQKLQHRDNDLQEELDALKKQLRVARGMTDDDVESLRNLRDLKDRLKQLDERVRALEAAQRGLSEQFARVLEVGEKGEGGASDVNALQFAALQGAVKNLERQMAELLATQEGQQDWSEAIRRLNEAVRAVEGDVEAARDQLQRTIKETARLDEVKANRSELPDTSLLTMNTKRRSSADSNALADLMGRLARAETSIDRLNEDKADRTALQKLRDELNALRQLVELADEQRRNGDGASDARTLAALEKMLREVQSDVNNLKELNQKTNLLNGGGLGGEDMEDLRDRVERLDHCKADATLVANKAERDYVENALERLMREVEQVLNATNAGLIDTLEKSLNILRDMIDGKATKQDVANLQGWMAETNGTGAGGLGAGAADGLTGFKGFRCLGCNRPMDNMRPRIAPATMTPFLNRNPQNFPQDNVTRTIQQQQQQQRIVGPGNSFTAGVRNAGAPSSGDLHRSTSSEPLPPIEPS